MYQAHLASGSAFATSQLLLHLCITRRAVLLERTKASTCWLICSICSVKSLEAMLVDLVVRIIARFRWAYSFGWLHCWLSNMTRVWLDVFLVSSWQRWMEAGIFGRSMRLGYAHQREWMFISMPCRQSGLWTTNISTMFYLEHGSYDG